VEATAQRLDVIVIGAGPAGLACAIELAREGLEYLVIEKGCLVNSLFHFPTQMVFFTTPELLEIGELPFVCSGEKPTRLEALKYYRRVVETLRLRVSTYEQVTSVSGRDGRFEVRTRRLDTDEARQLRCRKLIVATGNYDTPNRLSVPGEELAKVSHYYSEAHRYFGREVAVIGGGNSAAEAALELFRGGARVRLIHRGATLSSGLKYWVAPDIGNRIERREIEADLETVVTEIGPTTLRTRHLPTGKQTERPNDAVFALTGYRPDFEPLKELGLAFDARTLRPEIDEATLESNVPGLHLAGVVIAGTDSGTVFIENGRLHGRQIVAHLAARLRGQ
jgi:thioredoxin reductase (NADPH)